MRCYLIDIDGTLCNNEHRVHHILNSPKDWDSFFSGCADDKPIEHILDLVDDLAQSAFIVLVSGRPERTRQATIEWLNQHGVHFAALYMRADGDHRDDDIIKIELLAQLRADGYAPVLAFDDRTRVVQAWRANGIPCAQVAPGDF